MHALIKKTLLVCLTAGIALSISALASAQSDEEPQATTQSTSSQIPGDWTWMEESDSSGQSSQPMADKQSAGKWEWVLGSKDYSGSADYGTLGVAASSNTPGSRSNALHWTDAKGRVWVFGGYFCGNYVTSSIFTRCGDVKFFSDLWMFDPSTLQWTWEAGSSSSNSTGRYGTKGVAAVSNAPGSRTSGATSTDNKGRLWLFGGYGYDAHGSSGSLDDLWMFDTSTMQWTWVAGTSSLNQPGTYDDMGTASEANLPGSREEESLWADSNGNIWLFGGFGYDANGNRGSLNDMWMYNPASSLWTWESGSYTSYSKGEYGAVPSSRYNQSTSTDSAGKLWLFGGVGCCTSSDLLKNDLWKFDPLTTQWSWISGSSGGNDRGQYGTQGTAASTNVPGGRNSSMAWTDVQGNLWLFGGYGYDSSSNYGLLNDLWTFNLSTSQWTWMKGSTSIGQSGAYGVQGVASLSNTPGSRESSAGGADKDGNLWLFGGENCTSTSCLYWNDLWRYTVAYSATPTFTLKPGIYTALQTVAITSTTSGATIYYTTDGTTPTVSSTVFTGAITVSQTETIKAIAVVSGYLNSAVASATYTINLPVVATPVLSLKSGNYVGVQKVTITDTTAGAAIYYTVNGTTPTSASTKYSGAITIGSTTTLKAIGIRTGYTNSAVTAATYTITLPMVATPVLSLKSGSYVGAQKVTIADATSGAAIYYTVNGATPTSASAKYTGALTISSTTTLKAMAVASGYANSAVATATYAITRPQTATPTFSPAAGSYGAGQKVTLSDATSGATIYYTTNGATPTTSSTKYSSVITVSGTETLKAMAMASNATASNVTSATYTIGGSPVALIEPATAITVSGATLHAVANTQGLKGTYVFKYGTSKTALTSSTASNSLSASTAATSMSAALTRLKSKTAYYFEIVITTAGGVGTSSELSFTTN